MPTAKAMSVAMGTPQPEQFGRAGEEHIERSRDEHAVERCRSGQSRPAQVGQLAPVHFPPDLHADHGEKDDHQAIVHEPLDRGFKGNPPMRTPSGVCQRRK
jgi:hypothetical protein